MHTLGPDIQLPLLHGCNTPRCGAPPASRPFASVAGASPPTNSRLRCIWGLLLHVRLRLGLWWPIPNHQLLLLVGPTPWHGRPSWPAACLLTMNTQAVAVSRPSLATISDTRAISRSLLTGFLFWSTVATPTSNHDTSFCHKLGSAAPCCCCGCGTAAAAAAAHLMGQGRDLSLGSARRCCGRAGAVRRPCKGLGCAHRMMKYLRTADTGEYCALC
jgi:hypothetical protein